MATSSLGSLREIGRNISPVRSYLAELAKIGFANMLDYVRPTREEIPVGRLRRGGGGRGIDGHRQAGAE
jgi:hypothetical protein